jgi:hypothetical protein
VPSIVAAIRHDGQFVSLARGAIHDRLVCMESVVTDPKALGACVQNPFSHNHLLFPIPDSGREEGEEQSKLLLSSSGPNKKFLRAPK